MKTELFDLGLGLGIIAFCGWLGFLVFGYVGAIVAGLFVMWLMDF